MHISEKEIHLKISGDYFFPTEKETIANEVFHLIFASF